MKRGFALLGVVVILAVGVVGAWFLKPSLFPGESRRAATSAKTTEALVATTDHQGAVVAASLAKIGEANAETQESPQRSFIGQELTLTRTLLPPPDPTALIQAERRKAAILEGRVEESRRLYEQATKTAAGLLRERDEALAAKRVADNALVEAAAAHHATTVQMLVIGVVALIALAGWGYLKIYGVGPATLGQIAHDLKTGVPLEHAFDSALPPRMYSRVAKARKLAAP